MGKARVLFWLCLIWLGGPVLAKADIARELEGAQAALAAGDYETAFRQYRHFAEDKNNPLAQFTMAMFYQLGWGRPVDMAVACRWHQRAADGEIPAAQHFFAGCLLAGTGVPEDPAAAARWYERAAENGHTLSLCDLAALYIAGRGVAKEPAKGLALCRQAAEKPLVQAQIRMGRFLLEGDAEVRDFDAAYAWFEVAARSESPEAQYRLGLMNRDGSGREPDLHTALHWFEHAASRGYVPAYFQTGKLYFEAPADPASGKQRPEDVAKAYLWLFAAFERSNDPEELLATAEMLNRLREIMPATWIPDLDQKVAKHLAAYPAS